MNEEVHNPMYTPSKEVIKKRGYKYDNGYDAFKANSARIEKMRKEGKLGPVKSKRTTSNGYMPRKLSVKSQDTSKDEARLKSSKTTKKGETRIGGKGINI